MSKAFTRDENEGPDIPELIRPASTLPEGTRNYLTPGGAERLQRELADLMEKERPKLAGSTEDLEAKRQLFNVDQRIQQLGESLGSAEVVQPPAGASDVVRFGATVTVRGSSGNDSSYRIVGVDEIDLDRDWVSWQSPIAKALMNSKVGERVRFKFPAGVEELEIVAVSYETLEGNAPSLP